MLLRENIYDRLRTDILACRFAPGDEMREQIEVKGNIENDRTDNHQHEQTCLPSIKGKAMRWQ